MILVIIYLQVHHVMCARGRIQNVSLSSLTVGLSLSTLLQVRELSLWLSLHLVALGQQSEFSSYGNLLLPWWLASMLSTFSTMLPRRIQIEPWTPTWYNCTCIRRAIRLLRTKQTQTRFRKCSQTKQQISSSRLRHEFQPWRGKWRNHPSHTDRISCFRFHKEQNQRHLACHHGNFRPLIVILLRLVSKY